MTYNTKTIDNIKKALLKKYPLISSPITITTTTAYKGYSFERYTVDFSVDNNKFSVNIIVQDSNPESPFSFYFTNEEGSLEFLNLNLNNINKVMNLFIEVGKKYLVFSSATEHEPVLIRPLVSKDMYTYGSILNGQVFYNERFRQKKSKMSVPNKSSYIESNFSILYDDRNKKITEYFSIKLPFLYKSKIHLTFKVNEELDLAEIESDFNKIFRKKIINYINSTMKIKVNPSSDKELHDYINLLELLKY